jgi:FemAB-related protein (PEP-CTERM system-associated)
MSEATVTVEEYRGPDEDWDAFVRVVGGTHCHRIGWRRVMERVFGHEGIYLAARGADGALVGVLPLVRVRSVLFGHYLVSMPFLNAGGPLGSEAAIRALVAGATARARKDGVRLLELRSRTELPVDLAVSHRKITVRLDLPAEGSAALWKALGTKLRAQVKRPQKEGITVRFGPGELAPFFDIFARHMRDLGTPTQPRRFFEAIAAEFPDDLWVGCAYHGERAIAGGCGFRWGDEFEMTWASALREFNAMSPNMLLYWSFLERAADEGVRVFDFGRCSPGSGTHRFKRQWGAADMPLWWYGMGRDERVAATPAPTDSAYSWGPRVWKHLPMPVATALGPLIVRGIP